MSGAKESSSSPPKNGTPARLTVQVLTRVGQTSVGLYLLIQEAGRDGPARDGVMILIAVCLVGVETAKEIALAIVDRVFGTRSPP
jgi:hypothetical protein